MSCTFLDIMRERCPWALNTATLFSRSLMNSSRLRITEVHIYSRRAFTPLAKTPEYNDRQRVSRHVDSHARLKGLTNPRTPKYEAVCLPTHQRQKHRRKCDKSGFHREACVYHYADGLVDFKSYGLEISRKALVIFHAEKWAFCIQELLVC